jgi:hypothetical protein
MAASATGGEITGSLAAKAIPLADGQQLLTVGGTKTRR